MDATQSDQMAEKLQTVYEAIKRERPWDIRPVTNIYTTAKEKYMIELIKDGHDISDDTIAHVVGRCYNYHQFDNTEYICWFGFILTRKEYLEEHFKCKYFHNLNKRLICSNGGLYYPVDILSNPFGDWHPSTKQVSPEIQEVYTMIEEKWPNEWYDDEMHKYILKHLINEIDKGKHIPKYMKQHVVNGCFRNFHELDDRYHCYSGFLLREEDTKGLNSNLDIFHFRVGSLHYVMNSKYYNHTGFRYIQISGLRLRRYQTSQKIIDQTITSSMKNVNKLFDRLYHRDLIKPQLDDKFRLTWQETYLMNQMMSGEDIPNEVISHVLDGCYTYGHLLTGNYACCRGYIVTRDLFFYHDVQNCTSRHTISQDLKCYEGRVYHQNAEIPKGSPKPETGYIHIFANVRVTPKPKMQAKVIRTSFLVELNRKILERSRLPIPFAPPPPDILDQQPLGQFPLRFPPRFNIQRNNGLRLIPQNDDEIDVVVNEPEQMARQNLRHNRASPPPEIEI